MEKLDKEWFQMAIPVFLVTNKGYCVDKNLIAQHLLSQFDEMMQWNKWLKTEILPKLSKENLPVFFNSNLPVKKEPRKHHIQIVLQKGEHEDYFRIQMIPLFGKISTKKSKRLNWYQFFDSLKDPVYVIDQKRKIVYANQPFADFLQTSVQELVGSPLFSFFPQSKGTLIEEKQNEVLNSGASVHFQYYFPIPPYERWFDIQIIPIHDAVVVWIQAYEGSPINAGSKQILLKNIQQTCHFLPDPVILFNKQYEVIEANPAFYEAFLLSPNAALNTEYLWDWFFPDDHLILKEAIASVFSEGKTASFQLRVPISSRVKKTFCVHVVPVLDETTSPLFAMIQCCDITESVKQINILKDQIEYDHKMMDSLEFMLFALADGWKVQYANQSCRQFFGLQEEDLQQCYFQDIVPEIMRLDLGEKIRIAFSEKKSCILEGTPLRNRLFYAAIFTTGTGVLCLMRDVTEKDIQDQKKILEEKYMRFIVNNTPDAIYVQNKSGTILFANESYRKKEADHEIQELIKADQAVLEGNTIWNEFSYISGKKTSVMQLMQFPYRDTDGCIEGICGIIRDISATIRTDQIPVEHSVLWINLIQTIRLMMNLYIPFRDWIKSFILFLADFAQASELWICIKVDVHDWLMIDWKNDGSFQQVMVLESEAMKYCRQKNLTTLSQGHHFETSQSGLLSTISMLVEQKGKTIGWISLSRKSTYNSDFINILDEFRLLIRDYYETCERNRQQSQYRSAFPSVFFQMPFGLALFTIHGKFELCNQQFQQYFPQPFTSKDLHLFNMQFLSDDEVSLLKMGLMIQNNAENWLTTIRHQYGVSIPKEEIRRLFVLPIQDYGNKAFSDHYLLILQPSIAMSVEYRQFLDYWEQTNDDLHYKLQVIRGLLSILIKTTVNKNEIEMAKDMSRQLLRFSQTLRQFTDTTHRQIL